MRPSFEGAKPVVSQPRCPDKHHRCDDIIPPSEERFGAQLMSENERRQDTPIWIVAWRVVEDKAELRVNCVKHEDFWRDKITNVKVDVYLLAWRVAAEGRHEENLSERDTVSIRQ